MKPLSGLILVGLMILLVSPILAHATALNNVVDYTAMTKVDASNIISSLAAGNYTITADTRHILSYLFSDSGANYWAGDWSFKTSVRAVSSTSGSIYQCIWAVSNTADASFLTLDAANVAQSVSLHCDVGTWTIRLSNGGSASSYSASVSTWYYLLIARVGNVLTLKIYSKGDYAVGNLLDTLTINSCLTTSWRYLYGWTAEYYSTVSGVTTCKVGPLSYDLVVSVEITSSTTGTGYVSVDGGAITTPHTYSWLLNTTHTIAANDPANVVAGQSQYDWTSWSDAGAVSHSYAVAGAATVTADFQLQYYLTVSGGDSPTGAGWYNSGVDADASNSWVWDITPGQARYAITNYNIDGTPQNPARQYTGTLTTSSVTMSTYHTIAFADTTQYYFGVTDAHDSATGQAWYDTGTTTVASLVSRPVAGGAGTQYETTEWTGAGSLSSGGGVGSTTTGAFTITAYSTVTWNWKTQYYLTVTGGSSPTGQGWYDAASNANPSNAWVWGVSGGTRTALTNWQLDTVDQDPARSNTGTLSTPNIAMNAPHTANFVSATQYFLTVSGGNGITYGTASPTSDAWYDTGGATTVSSDGVWGRGAGTGTRVASWNIDGGGATNVATSGSVTTSSVSMSAAHTVNFTPSTQHFITITGGDTITYGTVPTISGDVGWYDSSGSTTIHSNWVWDTVAGQSRTAIYNYAVGGSNQNPTRAGAGTLITVSVSMSAPRTVTFADVTQFYLTVTGGHSVGYGTASPTADNWYDSGSSTTVHSDWVWTTGGLTYGITNYAIDGTNQNPVVQNHGTLTTSSITMSTYHTVAFSTATQFYVTVTSTTGGYVLGGGAYGSGATATLTAVANSGAYTFRNWLVNGTAGGTSNPLIILIYGVTSAEANFTLTYEDPTLISDTDIGTYLGSGDYIGLVFAPFTILLGDMFGGIIMFAIMMPLYNKTQSLDFCLVVWCLLSSVLTAALPLNSYRLAYVFLILGVASLLYRMLIPRG
jgi:hypothetical protein